MSEASDTVIHWFRRDFRVADNASLYEATKAGKSVIPVYILSRWKRSHNWTGPNRQRFLCDSLRVLGRNLEKLGGRLVIRQGEADEVICEMIREGKISAVHFNKDPDPFGKQMEEKVRRICLDHEVSCVGHDDVWLHGPSEILTQDRQPYRVFTPYSRNWLSIAKSPPVPTPRRLNTPTTVFSLPFPTLSDWELDEPSADLLPAGEDAAKIRLQEALEKTLPRYTANRNFPAIVGTSRVSQDLRFGLTSVRTILAEISSARQQAPLLEQGGFDTYVKELAWREFYFSILHHFPAVLDEEFNGVWRGLPWDEPGDRFEAWKSGSTGFPIVDAGMRQMMHTGFMHNRVRMITAMFLTKDLHLDWRLGESFFMQHLVDGEIASNNGGWQWSAGTGADAAPYFRIQNPWLQTKRYDPEGIYIKTWIPELRDISPQKFMDPPPVGQSLAAGYPAPCVDHRVERDRTLAIFKAHAQQRR